ncbi:hypothetical protein CDD81_2901 [Ophiocordyceps australis]|uniref:Uncharacterized protein n=1 Tax=Ophiocordyceps australis TaxID=1399860 RepID=A0A2C5X7E5_9HYPO|nr:hypothetical protein CDD81_2901 [Ophiocordyceps australis]
MTPTLRSQTHKDIQYPVVCTANIDSQILKDLLSHGLALVAKTDLSELVTRNDELASFQSPFATEAPADAEALNDFLDAIRSNETLSRKAFVVLDETTAKDKKSCQVATDGRDEEQTVGLDVAFRCQLSSVIHGLKAVEHDAQPIRAARCLRNEAALCGGVWEKQRADGVKAKPKRIDIRDYPVNENWDEYSGPDSPYTEIPYYPLFQTAKIDLDIINLFLKETYDQDWGQDDPEDEEHAILGVAFVTSTHKAPFHAGKATAPLTSAPQTPSILLGASPFECDAIVRSRFPAEGSEMNYNRFIIMDEYTEETKTVIVAANNEVDGQLLLSRCDWKGALISLVAMEDTGLTMERQCNEAVTLDAGIIRGP